MHKGMLAEEQVDGDLWVGGICQRRAQLFMLGIELGQGSSHANIIYGDENPYPGSAAPGGRNPLTNRIESCIMQITL